MLWVDGSVGGCVCPVFLNRHGGTAGPHGVCATLVLRTYNIPPKNTQVLEECLTHHKEFRRLVLLVTWLELLRERDLWLLRDEVDGLVSVR